LLFYFVLFLLVGWLLFCLFCLLLFFGVFLFISSHDLNLFVVAVVVGVI